MKSKSKTNNTLHHAERASVKSCRCQESHNATKMTHPPLNMTAINHSNCRKPIRMQQGANILPSDINKFPCFTNFRYCFFNNACPTMCVAHPPCQGQSQPHTSPSGQHPCVPYGEPERHLSQTSQKRAPSHEDYLIYAERTLSQHSRDNDRESDPPLYNHSFGLQCPHTSNQQVGTQQRSQTGDIFVPACPLHMSADTITSYSSSESKTSSLSFGGYGCSFGDASNRSQLGSSRRHSDLDTLSHDLDARSRNTDGVHSTKTKPDEQRRKDAQSHPLQPQKQKDMAPSIAGTSSLPPAPPAPSPPEMPPAPLYILQRNDNPSTGQDFYSVLTVEQPSAQEVFKPPEYSQWARGQELVDTESSSPKSSECGPLPETHAFQTKQEQKPVTLGNQNTSTGQNLYMAVPAALMATGPLSSVQQLFSHQVPQKDTINQQAHEDEWEFVDRQEAKIAAEEYLRFCIDKHQAKETPKETQGFEATKSKADKSTLVNVKRRLQTTENPTVKKVDKTDQDKAAEISAAQMSHCSVIGDYLRQLWMNDQLCDIVVHIGTYTFTAHRLALAAHSAYFADMVMLNYQQPSRDICLDGYGITPAAFKAVLDFIYFGETVITMGNLSELSVATNVLKINSLISQCEELQKRFTPDNALIVLNQSSSEVKGTETYQRALSLVASAFQDVRHSDAFLSLQVKRVCEILGSDALVVSSEKDVFRAALEWLKVDPNRSVYVPHVISCVRFINMDPEDIVQCTNEFPFMFEEPTCREKILSALWFSSCRLMGTQCHIPIDLPKARKFRLADGRMPAQFNQQTTQTSFGELKPCPPPSKQHEAPGLSSGSNVNHQEGTRVDKTNQQVYQPCVQTMTGPSVHHPSVVPERISVEGVSQGCFNKDCPLYFQNAAQKKKTTDDSACSPAAKVQTSIVHAPNETEEQKRAMDALRRLTCGGPWHVDLSSKQPVQPSNLKAAKIAIIGGLSSTDEDKSVGSSVFVFDEGDQSWSLFSRMPEPRHLHAAAILGSSLYVVGGANPFSAVQDPPSPTGTVFKLDLATGMWSTAAQMKHRRIYHKMCVLENLLYVIGGQNEANTVLNSVEVYNPVTNSWVEAAPMKMARLGMGVAAFGGLIYAVGGYCSSHVEVSGQPILSTVECYSPTYNRWFRRNPLRIPRCYGNLVVANDILFLCGGATKSFTLSDSVMNSINSVDAYDDQRDIWYMTTSMETARHGAVTAVTDSKLYIFGGVNSAKDDALASYECYDIRQNRWDNFTDDMPWSRVGMAAVVISDL